MIYLEDDKLIMRFPDLDWDAGVEINLKRTLRIPDDRRLHDLPPDAGNFPLRHIEDYDLGENNNLKDRGGLLMPMFQGDGMFLQFKAFDQGSPRGALPIAIKIGTGKVCALSGKPWEEGLNKKRQNYAVVPGQPWIDGYVGDKGSVRQFVAAPLGDGVTAEEQIQGTADIGGIQIQAYPMKREFRAALLANKDFTVRSYQMISAQYSREVVGILNNQDEISHLFNEEDGLHSSPGMLMPRRRSRSFMDRVMGVSAGGRMRQEIFEDPYGLDVWDQSQSEKCFITIANAEQWMDITNEAPPLSPVSAEQYAAAGLPWFSYYDDDLKALDGAKKLRKLKSFQSAYADKGQTQWSEETLKHKPVVKPIVKRRVDPGEW
jgi:hypothetical protein